MKRHTSKHWRVLPGDPLAEELLQQELNLHPVVARLLVQRGIVTSEDAEEFLDPSLDRLHDPFLLPDAEPACERLKQALANKEKITVHGDYDGDGVTSSALWTRVLRSLGGDVDVFVPHRKHDGYDIRSPFIERAKAAGTRLIVTTDCGIQRIDEVEQAREAGIDVIITDHHTPNANGSLPKAVAVVNPHRHDSKYPFRDLAGVGVAFKLCEALVRSLGHKPHQYRQKFLDLAAIGTVTDVMPLLGENRIIVRHGLEALQNTNKVGLRALIDAAGFSGKPLDTYSIGFGLGPRLNSASRMEDARYALDLLLTKDESEALALARRLNELNAQRKEETQHILEEAMAQVAQQDMMEARCLVISGSNWQSGLVGLVASRLVDRFHRPCIVIACSDSNGLGKGSARSIHAFNIFEAIHACRDLLTEFGGHAHAAGLSIEQGNIPDFAAQMNRLAGALLTDEDLRPGLEVASELAPEEIGPELLAHLETLAPFGHGNPSPLFVSRGVPVLEVSRMGKENEHLRLKLRAEGLNRGGVVAAPWFRQGDLADGLQAGMTLDICYRPQFNVWNGNRSIQFLMEDIQPPQW